jgi:probable rRNA maturation factor
MVYIQIDDLYIQDKLEDLLVNTAQTALRHQKLDPSEEELTIVLTGDEEIKELNLQYLGVDSPTDVLSFAGGDIDPENGQRYLGDIIISYQQAKLQADARAGSDRSELQLLVVHGVLHLLGFDHADDLQKKEMWVIQGQILQELGLESINPN